MSKKLQTGTSEIVYTALKDQILHLELRPGELVSEIVTSQTYHVSRTPVRDAFKMLELEGLLEVRPHIGTFVSQIDLNQTSTLLYMREVLEQAVLHDLALSFTPAQGLKLNVIISKQKSMLSTEKVLSTTNSTTSEREKANLRKAFLKSDTEFHAALYTLAGKAAIWEHLQTINQHYERFRSFLKVGETDNLQALYEEHQKILDCIFTKDLDELRKTITKHLYSGFNQSTEIIKKYPDYFKIES
ncbi:MAG: GntR family transcriptional regulator [Lachnospiraceae bacterium]|nr:GntR family transcriptional regulator [Lachnospiraceae bacterium]